MTLKRVVEEENFVIATWRNILFRIGSGEASPERITMMHQQATQLLSTHRDGIGIMLWLYAGSPLPNSLGRSRATNFFKELGPSIQTFAVVIEGTGFWASSVRSVLTGLTLISRTSFPLKTFSTSDKGTQWMSPLLAPSVTQAELTATVRELTEAHSPPLRHS